MVPAATVLRSSSAPRVFSMITPKAQSAGFHPSLWVNLIHYFPSYVSVLLIHSSVTRLPGRLYLSSSEWRQNKLQHRGVHLECSFSFLWIHTQEEDSWALIIFPFDTFIYFNALFHFWITYFLIFCLFMFLLFLFERCFQTKYFHRGCCLTVSYMYVVCSDCIISLLFLISFLSLNIPSALSV